MSVFTVPASLLSPAIAGEPNPVALLIWLAIGVGAILVGAVAVTITRRRASGSVVTEPRSRESVETGSIASIA